MKVVVEYQCNVDRDGDLNNTTNDNERSLAWKMHREMSKQRKKMQTQKAEKKMRKCENTAQAWRSSFPHGARAHVI
jgi:hypothetical protein